jgi:hypothetical protein
MRAGYSEAMNDLAFQALIIFAAVASVGMLAVLLFV